MNRARAALAAVAATTLVGVVGLTSQTSQQASASCVDARAITAWNGGVRARFVANASSGYTPRMYEAYDQVKDLIGVATRCSDLALAEDIANALDGARGQMVPYDFASYGTPGKTDLVTWANNPTGAVPYGNGEGQLDTLQFLQGPGRLLELFASTPTRTSGAQAWMTAWAPILREHVAHYVARTTWAPPSDGETRFCTVTGSTDIRGHEQRLARITASTNAGTYSGCNSVDDRDMWVASLAAEYRTANLRDPAAAPLPADLPAATLDRYLSAANAAVRARSSTTTLTDLTGKTVTGRVFDAAGLAGLCPPGGIGTGYSTDYCNSADQIASPPPNGCGADRPVRMATRPGWDVSHFRRWPDVAEELRTVAALSPAITGAPTDDEMRQYAAQFAYAAWNKSTSAPKFTNYENGDGWYRPGYGFRAGFGYGPSQLSADVPRSGYGAWARYNADVGVAWTALGALLEATSGPAYDLRTSTYVQPWSGCVKGSPVNVSATSDLMLAYYAAGSGVTFLPPPTTTTRPPSTTVPCLRIKASGGTVTVNGVAYKTIDMTVCK